MSTAVAPACSAFLEGVYAKNPAQDEFHQAVCEVVESIWPVLDKRPEYRKAKIIERIVEPDRVLMFRVPWIDDKGEVFYRSPGVFVEYYKNAEWTASTKDAEGWVATGDAGFIEEGTGHLRIIDRLVE